MSTLACERNGVVITCSLDLLGLIWRLCRGATQWPDGHNDFFCLIKKKKLEKKKEALYNNILIVIIVFLDFMISTWGSFP